jgi:hypothetical protein
MSGNGALTRGIHRNKKKQLNSLTFMFCQRVDAAAAATLRWFASNRMRVYDAPHRALLLRYATLPPAQQNVSLACHAELCHRHAGKAIFTSAGYYTYARPLLALVTTGVLPQVPVALSCLLAYVVYDQGTAYADYLAQRAHLLADLDMATVRARGNTVPKQPR